MPLDACMQLIKEKRKKWAYELSNYMVNRVIVIGDEKVIATWVDGKIVILEGMRPDQN